MQSLHGLHSALPDRQHRQLARRAARQRLQPRGAVGWDVLPDELSAEEFSAAGVSAPTLRPSRPPRPPRPKGEGVFTVADYAAVIPPWSAAHPYGNLYGPRAAEQCVTATVTGNVRVTEVGREYDTHHIVLDFGAMPFPVLEGQSIGIVPPGLDAEGGHAIRGNIRSRARATANGRATTTSRSP